MSEDSSFCPVQARKVCLAKTGDKCKNKELLFISNKMASKETFTPFALCLGQEADPTYLPDRRGGGAVPT